MAVPELQGDEPQIAIGRLLAHFRARKGWSIRALARHSGVSHTYLADLERGFTRLTGEVLTKIADDRALSLSADDRRRLWDAAEQPADVLVAPGYIVPLTDLIEAEGHIAIREVWVVGERPLELDHKAWMDVVGRNIRERRCNYVYFVPDITVWQKMRDSLETAVGSDALGSRVMCVQVPVALHIYLFHPNFGIYIYADGSIRGAWAFRGPESNRIDSGTKMDNVSAQRLHNELKWIVNRCRQGKRASLDSSLMAFDLLHPGYCL